MLRYRSNEDVTLVIDDNDPSVTYSGDWGTTSYTATYFHAYGSTIHYTLQPNANVSISFYGSYITVFGVIPSIFDLENSGFALGSQVQSSYRFDDGPTEFLNATLDVSQDFTDQVFFQPSTTKSDGHHTLVITNVVGALTLDYFTIVPAYFDSNPYQYIQKIDDASPNITYNNAKPLSNTSQANFNNTLHSLSSPQSTASLNFNGNFVAVYGALPAGNSLPVVSFTLDNVDQPPPIPTGKSEPLGSVPHLSPSRKQRLSQVLFWKSSILNDGQHNLLITVTQGEFLLDFILIQTSDGAEAGLTSSSQSLMATTKHAALPSSTNAPPYGSATAATSSGSASRSPPSGAPSDHTKYTAIIVGGAVGFIVLLLALYMVWILFKRRSGLRCKTQSNTESSSLPPVQATLPVTTIATAGKPYLVDGSGPHVTGYILRSSCTLSCRSNSSSVSLSPHDLTQLSLPTNSQRMSENTAACYTDNTCLPVRQSMLDTHRSSLPSSLPPANRSSTGHGPYQGYGRTLVTPLPPLPPSLPPENRSITNHDAHQGYEYALDTQRLSRPYRSSTGHGPHQEYEHTIDSLRSSAPSLPPTYRSSTGHDAHQGYEHTQRPSLPPSLPPTYRSSTGHCLSQGYEHTPDTRRPSLPPSLPPTYRSSAGHGAHQGYEPYEGIVKD